MSGGMSALFNVSRSEVANRAAAELVIAAQRTAPKRALHLDRR
jgi:hypothetical protein